MEAERSRADDYYLAEGTGFAERYTATADGRVEALGPMDGDAYEAWVSGVDPGTGELRGRVRGDGHALRFTEVVVNGPKSWSIAAELHPAIAAAYGGAQDRAAVEIVRWMGQNATTRVGPRGGQVSTSVSRIEAAAVRHYTSRAGDPHRHIHLQVNARVFAAGKWRGVDSVAVRNSIKAVQGIGHAAVMADPPFREALASHGFSLDPESGEVIELAGYVTPFSTRATQISDQVAGYEAQWRTENPDREPGPTRRRAWDARAWAEHRPDKAHVEPGEVLNERWLTELDALGYQPPVRPVEVVATPVGGLDRDAAAAEVSARLTAAGSAWNQADIRGEAELLIARHGIIAAGEVRRELAEDLVARAAGAARPLPGLEARVQSMPEHIRTWTSAEAIAVETELVERLAGRAAADAAAVGQQDGSLDASPEQMDRAAVAAGVRLDPAQAEAVAVLAGGHALVLVTGAAGAGKTTTLATTRAALDEQGHRLVVVTPTLKAARSARAETGAQAGSVAWLIYAHGWRHDEAGRWARLSPGEPDTGRWARPGSTYQGPHESAQLAAGDLVVVDEAGMLDQDTARALLQVVDEAGARVALVGDRHQLPAIGRGGVLDLAARWAERSCTLDVIHRFTRQVEIAPGITEAQEDLDYAALSLRMRDGAAGEPGSVFDELATRGQVRLHASEEARRDAVATEAADARRAGRTAAVSVATNDAAAVLNAAIRDQLVATGHVGDGSNGDTVATTGSGQRIGTGDVIVTRANNRDLDVANRDTWTVLAVSSDGSLTITPTTPPVAGGTVGDRVLPAGYVNRHVQLGYAGTIHGVQGETAHTGLLVLDEHTSVQAAYVGMTRGRTANDLHLVAEDLDEARSQWVDTAGRGRADLGLEAARVAAEREAAPYAPTPTRDPAVEQRARLVQVLDELGRAWTEQARAGEQLERLEPRLAAAQAERVRREENELILGALRQQMNDARAKAKIAETKADLARTQLNEHANQLKDRLQEQWREQWPVAAGHASAVAAGSGKLSWLTGASGQVAEARNWLQGWASRWQPVLADLDDIGHGATPPDGTADAGLQAALRVARRHQSGEHIDAAIHDHAGHETIKAHPDLIEVVEAARRAEQTAEQAGRAYVETSGPLRQRESVLHAYGGYRNLAEDLPRLSEQTSTARARHTAATERVEQLTTDPVITSRDDAAGFLIAAHTTWTGQHIAAHAATIQRSRNAAARDSETAAQQRLHDHDQPHYGPAHGHNGPSLGR